MGTVLITEDIILINTVFSSEILNDNKIQLFYCLGCKFFVSLKLPRSAKSNPQLCWQAELAIISLYPVKLVIVSSISKIKLATGLKKCW